MAQPDRYEYNDDRINAKTLSGASGSLTANLHNMFDQDWFRFSLEDTGSSSDKISLTKSSPLQVISLYNSKGVQIKSTAKTISLSGLARGTYYAKIYDLTNMATGNYTLAWNTQMQADKYEYNNTRARAKDLSGGSAGSLGANIHSSNDVDWYKLYLTHKGISGNAISLSNGVSSQTAELYNSAGAKVKGSAKTLSLQGLAKGTYYVRVYDSKKRASGAYNLVWNLDLAKDKYDAAKANDTLKTATWLPGTSGTLDANIHGNADVDWFKFNLAAKGASTNKLSITSDSKHDYKLYNYIEIYNASGKKVKKAAKTISLQGLNKGTYYAKIYNSIHAIAGDYKLAWNIELAKDRYDAAKANDTLKKATNLSTTSGTVNASIHGSADVDWYKFTLAATGTKTNKVTVSGASTQRVEIYNASGQKVKAAAKAVSLAGLAKGVYYARVYDGKKAMSGNYTLAWNVELPKDRYDAAKANDTLKAATALSGTESELEASLHNASDVDWYKFTLAATGTKTNKVTVAGASTQRVEIYNSSGQKVKAAAKSVSLAGLAKGAYYARVYDGKKAMSGNYTLAWNTTAPIVADKYENNDLFSSATALTKLSGSLSASIHTSKDVDYYKITFNETPAKGNYARVATTSGTRPLMVVYDSAHKIRGWGDFSFFGSSSGDYYIAVYGNNGAKCNYNLEWNTNPAASYTPDKYENNNSFARATILDDKRGNIYANISTASDVDYYRINLESLGDSSSYVRLSPRANAAGSSLEMAIYDRSGNRLDGTYSSTSTKTIYLENYGAGTYYVAVSGTAGATNDYTFSWFTGETAEKATADKYEANNSRLTATKLGKAGSLQASISSAVDKDFYQIRLDNTAGRDACFYVSKNSHDGNLVLRLYDSTGKQLDYRNVYAGNYSGSSGIDLEGRAAGTYYISVEGNEGDTGNYNLIWNTNTEKPVADKQEANNNRAMATRLARTSGNLPASIHNGTDEDWYEIKLTSRGVKTNYVCAAFDQSLGDLEMTLYNSDGDTVAFSHTSHMDGEYISLAGKSAGTYYVQVFGWDKATGNYNLSWNTEDGTPKADRYEANNTLATATKLTATSGELSASIHNGKDVDFYRLSLAAEGTGSNYVRAEFEHDYGDLKLSLYNSKGVLVCTSDISSNDLESEGINLAGLSAGTYYVALSGVNGDTNNYELSWNTGAAGRSILYNDDAGGMAPYADTDTLTSSDESKKIGLLAQS